MFTATFPATLSLSTLSQCRDTCTCWQAAPGRVEDEAARFSHALIASRLSNNLVHSCCPTHVDGRQCLGGDPRMAASECVRPNFVATATAFARHTACPLQVHPKVHISQEMIAVCAVACSLCICCHAAPTLENAAMPVPVSASNPDGKGLSVHQNTSLPSAGGLFSRLGAASATDALESKKHEQAVDREQRTATARQANGHTAPDSTTSPESSGPSIVCQGLQFRYNGDDGLPIPGAFLRTPKFTLNVPAVAQAWTQLYLAIGHPHLMCFPSRILHRAWHTMVTVQYRFATPGK